MTLLIFLTKVIICSAAFFGYYFFFLRNKRFHQYNRYYLLIGAALSILLPLVQIPVLLSGRVSENALFKTLNVITVSGWEDEFVVTPHQSVLSLILTFKNVASFIYLAGFIILTAQVVKFILYLKKLSRTYTAEQTAGVTFYNTGEPGTPFSFFNAVYWNEKILVSSEKGQQILQHELFHIRAGHSYDIIFMKVITIFFWFNPFCYLFMKEIKAIHEFLADEHASSTADRYDYAELLVTEAINNKNIFLSNQFFHNQIKRRITMLIKNNPSSFSYLRRIMALPLLLILFCAFAFKTGGHYNLYNNTGNKITVVIDAGHGGNDPGARSTDGRTEKELTLSIAQKIKNLGEDYGINVIMTRDEDIQPGNALSNKNGLKNRTNILEENNADLFVSIHVGASASDSRTGQTNGFDIYVSGENKQSGKSRLLGSAISEEIRKTYKIADALKERKSSSIWVLKNSSVPAVLIECGYITNKTDLEFITNTHNQEKIAHDILRGIVNYKNSSTTLNHSNNQQKGGIDTIPASEFSKIKPENIKEINVNKDIIVIKLKNGDSAIVKTADYSKENNKVIADTIQVVEDMEVTYKNADGDTVSVKANITYKANDKVIADTKSDDNIIFTQTEIEASYPGGSKEWLAYLNKNFKYPQEAQDQGIKGTVIVRFHVDKEGNVSDVEALSGPETGGLKEESIRIIKNSGKWIPAKQNGLSVKSYKKQPITYMLEAQ